MTAYRIAFLRARYDLTKNRAALVARMAWGIWKDAPAARPAARMSGGARYGHAHLPRLHGL
ncbi:hypothetical protein [Paracoccus sp. T5]|uniref:hypothetical protein n=1 Tax=Paracoccus sp. T5 TaxID=3402161 RepID=UPI003AE89624